jgi:hypothetical protein
MYELYIKVENGQTVNHPSVTSNLIDAFGSIPENYEPFIRTLKPKPPTPYEVVLDTPVYQKVDGVWTDVWLVRDMTEEEKAALNK